MSPAISMKMSSTMVCQTSWADVVKGKEGIASPPAQKKKKFNAAASEFVPKKKAVNASCTQQKFSFNAEAPEFSVPELKMNALAPEFVPPVTQGAKELIPVQHTLLSKAAEMQKVLLECYTDDDSSDDEVPAPVVQKRKPASKRGCGPVLPFRAPPGLAPPAVTLNPLAVEFDPPVVTLNPLAVEFDPSTAFSTDGKIGSAAAAFTNAINLEGFYSEDEDHVSDNESIVSTPREFSKMDQISLHDSTSAGESSDSETESWSGPHSP